MEETAKIEKISFTDRLRIRFKGILDPIGAFLNRLGLTPNMVTVLGLVGNIFSAVLLAQGYIVWGGVTVLLMWPVDALDGTMARLRGDPSDFGAFVDSVTDRYSELFVFGGLLYYFISRDELLASMLIFLSASGSVLVSYTRARAEGLGYSAKNGILTRVERYLVLVPGLVFNIPLVSLWILAVFANFTALQRIWHVRQQARRKKV